VSKLTVTTKPRAKLPATVVGLGIVSLFTDVSSEAIFPLLPAFLTTMGASNAFIGFVEGAADLVANVLKYFVGKAADGRPTLKPLVLAGYGVSTVVRPLMAFTATPAHVLWVRIADRIGKGIRTAPRDALIAAATDPSIRGQAYGFHRAMDHGGAAIGTLLGVGLLWLMGVSADEPATAEQLRTVFLWAGVPGVLAYIALILTKEPPRPALPPVPRRGRKPISLSLKRAIGPMMLFAFANATDAFILVKAARLGASPMMAPLLWLVLHVVKAATATTGGALADRYGKRNALALGWSIYAVTWSAVGFTSSMPVLVALTAFYGTSHGLVEGAERALVAELADGQNRGQAFGAYNMLVGLAALGASWGFGFVWDTFGDAVAFVGAGSCALLAAGLLLVLVPKTRRA
jgi:MFS family permease